MDQVLAEFTIILNPLAWVNEIGKTEKKQDHGFCDHGIWFLVVSNCCLGSYSSLNWILGFLTMQINHGG